MLTVEFPLGRMLPLRSDGRRKSTSAVSFELRACFLFPFSFLCFPRHPKTESPVSPVRHDSSKRLLASIDKNFGTLPWCKRYLDRTGEKGYALAVSFFSARLLLSRTKELTRLVGLCS